MLVACGVEMHGRRGTILTSDTHSPIQRAQIQPMAVRQQAQQALLLARRRLAIGYRSSSSSLLAVRGAWPRHAHTTPSAAVAAAAIAPRRPPLPFPSGSASPALLLALLSLGAAGTATVATTAPSQQQEAAVAAAANEPGEGETAAEHAPYLERIDARLHRAYPEFMEEVR